MVVLKTRKWLSDDEFKEVLMIADYIGYEEGYKKFVFNLAKALKNGYFLSDVKELIKELNLEVEGSFSEVEKAYSALATTLEWNSSDCTVKIVIPSELYKVNKNRLMNLGCRFSATTNEHVVLKVLPYQVHRVIDFLKSIGVPVNDPQKLVAEKPLMIKPTLVNVKLRSYQEEALEAWLRNNGSGIIALPTGSGKTLIAVAALVEKSVKTLIIAYTREQLYQWRDFILKYTSIPSSMVGLFYGEEKRLAPVTVSTYQSAFRNMGILSPHFDFLIVDEVHHLPADKFKYIAYHSLAKYKMGLSATPEREDGKHVELFPLLGNLVYYKSPSELAEQGYLASYEVIVVRVSLTPQERLLYSKIKKQIETLMTKLPEEIITMSNRKERFKRILKEAYRGNSVAKEILKLYSDLRMLVATSNSKIEKAVEIALKEIEKGNKIIVFTQYVDQAKTIASRVQGYLLTGETPDQDRKRILESFKTQHKGILVVTTVGDEGIDIPDANVGIIVSGTGSRRQFIQRLGRLLRPKSSGQRAVLYEIVVKHTVEEIWASRRTQDVDQQ
ncbi:MAG: DEAD/DEAH box helicase [Desulfurococcaceae archaeon]